MSYGYRFQRRSGSSTVPPDDLPQERQRTRIDILELALVTLLCGLLLADAIIPALPDWLTSVTIFVALCCVLLRLKRRCHNRGTWGSR